MPSEKIAVIAEKLFSVPYKILPENVDIDLSPIIRYLIFHDEDGNTWRVELGLRRHNERWYDPINDKELINLLYESTVNQLGTFYTLDEAYDKTF